MTTQRVDSSTTPNDAVTSRRTQRRLGVQIPIQVMLPHSNEPITAMNQDISWGGAQFVAAMPPAGLSGMLRLIFPWRGQDKISVVAEVVRAQRLDGGRYQVAVRFASLSPRSQARLEKLLKMLYAADGDSAADAESLVRDLEVSVDDSAEMREMLGQVADGALVISVFEPYEAGQSIRLSIHGADKLPGIRLRARVLEVTRVKLDGFAQSELFSLKLVFEHPPAAIKGFVDLLMKQLPPVWQDAESSFAAAPEWLRAMHLARPTEEVDVSASVAKSVLEERFPGALSALTRAWGDPAIFDICFRDLTLGPHAEPGGWPEDAWDELGFLQDVHDDAYGLPVSRRGALRPTRCR